MSATKVELKLVELASKAFELDSFKKGQTWVRAWIELWVRLDIKQHRFDVYWSKQHRFSPFISNFFRPVSLASQTPHKALTQKYLTFMLELTWIEFISDSARIQPYWCGVYMALTLKFQQLAFSMWFSQICIKLVIQIEKIIGKWDVQIAHAFWKRKYNNWNTNLKRYKIIPFKFRKGYTKLPHFSEIWLEHICAITQTLNILDIQFLIENKYC